VAEEQNPAEAGCQLVKPTSLPLRCHIGKEVKCLRKVATSRGGDHRDPPCPPTHFEDFGKAQQYPSPEEG